MINPTKKTLQNLMEVAVTHEGGLVVSRYYSKEAAIKMFKDYEGAGLDCTDIKVMYIGKAQEEDKDFYENTTWILSDGFEYWKSGEEPESSPYNKKESPYLKSDYEVWYLQNIK